MIKAIETKYQGYRFRSRLEARWAVFFDALGLQWEYEKEGFDLDGEWYLPDFWLPQVRMWAEVKPENPSPTEDRLMMKLAKSTNHSVLKLVGVPENKPYRAWEWNSPEYIGELNTFGVDVPEFLEIEYCLTCYHGYPFDENRFYSSPGSEDDGRFDDVAQAAEIARSARFEHGETPLTGKV